MQPLGVAHICYSLDILFLLFKISYWHFLSSQGNSRITLSVYPQCLQCLNHHCIAPIDLCCRIVHFTQLSLSLSEYYVYYFLNFYLDILYRIGNGDILVLLAVSLKKYFNILLWMCLMNIILLSFIRLWKFPSVCCLLRV